MAIKNKLEGSGTPAAIGAPLVSAAA